MITFVKIVVIQPSSCKGNFNKTIYLSTYLSIYLSIYLVSLWKFSELKGSFLKNLCKFSYFKPLEKMAVLYAVSGFDLLRVFRFWLFFCAVLWFLVEPMPPLKHAI